MATNDVSVELDDFGGSKENFLIPKKKKKEELMAEMGEMHNNVKSMYETMTHEGYEDSLNEIEKMHNEMKRLYADMAKLEK